MNYLQLKCIFFFNQIERFWNQICGFPLISSTGNSYKNVVHIYEYCNNISSQLQ